MRIGKQIFFYQFPKQRKIYYYIFRRLIPFSGIRRFFTIRKENFTTMTDTEKALLQAQHRLEEAQARNRVKERKARTRRLIQTGGNSGKGAAGGANDGAASIGGIPITKNTAKRLKHSEGLRETGGRFLFPKGALTHHLPEAGGGIPPVGRERALSEGISLSAESDRQCHSTCRAAVIVCAAVCAAPS